MVLTMGEAQFALEQSMKTERGSKEIALLFLSPRL
jgi:hypothetical protein